MSTLLRLLIPVTPLCLAGCLWEPLASCADFNACGTTTDATSSSGGTLPTASTGGGSPTTTSADPSSSSTEALEPGSSSDPSDGSTTAEPVPPPAIVERTLALTPDPLKEPGTINIALVAEHAQGVRMQVDDGDAIDLGGGPGEYAGGIPIYTGLSSGTHYATFVAWRDGLESEPVVVPFEVDLLPPGDGYVWESADLIGNGRIAAVAALPPSDGPAVMVEWGTMYEGGQPRCYLRRRGAHGTWGQADYVKVLPGSRCVATDLEVGPDGTLYLLATRATGNDPWWWLGQVTTWETAATPENVSSGGLGEVGFALALGGSKLAVCGTRPIVNPVNDKIDAAVWIVGDPVQIFDYNPSGADPHKFDEALSDCVFDGETLVAVGNAFGQHTKNDPKKRRRHLQLRLDLGTDTVTPYVGAEVGAATQSAANAVTIAGNGRAVSVGYLCGDACDPEVELWVHGADGALEWYASLGADLATPSAIATSPAGYVVLAGAKNKGPLWSGFWMGAYFIGDYAPVWTFNRDDAPQLQSATAVAVGPAGHVYGGGGGADGYPAVVYVAP